MELFNAKDPYLKTIFIVYNMIGCDVFLLSVNLKIEWIKISSWFIPW